MSSLLEYWRDATLRPRTGLPRLVREDPSLFAVVFPMCWGILQTFMQAATNSVGLRSGVPWILLVAIPIGSLWGLLQLHLVAGSLWVVVRRGPAPPSFSRVRHVVALSSGPAAYAFVAWLVAAVLLGRIVFVHPDTIESGSVLSLLRLSVLYLGTAACILWGVALLVLGLGEITGRSTMGAVGALATSLVVLVAACTGLVVLGVGAAMALGVGTG